MCPSPPWFHYPERRLLAGFLGLLWSVLAGALAILALVGHRWAAIALVSSTGGIAVLSLLATLTSAAAGLPLIAAVLVVTLMLRPEVRTWYAARAHERALARRR